MQLFECQACGQLLYFETSYVEVVGAGSSIKRALVMVGPVRLDPREPRRCALIIVWAAEHYRGLTKRLEDEQKYRELAVEELAHRLKNKVATIQSIVVCGVAKTHKREMTSRTRLCTLRRNTTTCSERNIFGFKSALRPEWRDQDGKHKTSQRDHCALTLGDSLP
jgi:hypothetical protein